MDWNPAHVTQLVGAKPQRGQDLRIQDLQGLVQLLTHQKVELPAPPEATHHELRDQGTPPWVEFVEALRVEQLVSEGSVPLDAQQQVERRSPCRCSSHVLPR